MLVGCVLHEVIARFAVQAAVVAVEFVFLAPVAPLSLYIRITWALAELVALEALRATLVTIARLTTLVGEPVLVLGALVASLARYTRFTEALAVVATAGVSTAQRIAFAALAAIS